MLHCTHGMAFEPSEVAHQAGAYPSFLFKATRSISTPPWMGCYSNPLQGYPIYLGGERHHGSKVSCPGTHCNDLGQGLNLDGWIMSPVHASTVIHLIILQALNLMISNCS